MFLSGRASGMELAMRIEGRFFSSESEWALKLLWQKRGFRGDWEGGWGLLG
jgi:hypothetical protein